MLASAASISLAQETSPPPPASTDDIVITGSNVTPRRVETAARKVTASGNLYSNPLSQFQEPVCPGIIGMPADFVASMNARIRFIAEQAKIPLAQPSICVAKSLVIFIPSGQAAMQNLLENGPWLFGPIKPAVLKDLKTDPALKYLAADPGQVHVG